MTKTLSRLIDLILVSLTTVIAGCDDRGSDEPHQATLCDICEVVSAEASKPTTLHLYRPDNDTPVTLTAPVGVLGSKPPETGSSILVAYLPDNGQAYTDTPITILNWSVITNLAIAQAKDTDELQGWDSDPVKLLSAWRAGGKICMRLQLPYSTSPRRFSLLIDPETADDPIPTAYLYHLRPIVTPTHDRQYYVAIDISSVWSKPETEGLRIRVANMSDPALTTILFTKK